MKKYLIIGLIFVLFCDETSAQSGQQFRRFGVHNANQVRTVFGNWGVIGQPRDKGPRGSWRRDNNGYLGDVSILVGAEVRYRDSSLVGSVWVVRDTTFRSVVTVPVERPTQLPDESPSGKRWTFEPVGGYFNANQERVAMSTDRVSWPPLWPDKMNDLNDPGWRDSWNGYFGKRSNATQESYFVMDDNNDERFNNALNNVGKISFKPDPLNPSRNGLGLEVRVRGLQWTQFLAKDNIFWLYEITNSAIHTYDRVVFGMLVGTYLGVTGTDDRPAEYDDDWSFYDVQTNVTYTGDFDRSASRNPSWQGPVGMVGYAFLESPGNPFDGIDNDADADTIPMAATAPKFIATSFDSVLVTPGMRLVLINADFSRTVYVVPATPTTVRTRGATINLVPGVTKLAEGNIIFDANRNPLVNPNAYDGIDNDLDGIIDENFYLHFRQLKQTRTVPPRTLIDVLRPLRAIDYVNNGGTSPYSMIDEKRNDRIDNNNDWNFVYDDVGRDGIPSTGDFGESDGQPTSGYDSFGNDTGLPGEPHVDKTDVRESDQIGLTSFYYFAPAGNVRLGDDNSLWTTLAPGFFDVPTSIVANRPERGEDGDFIYGSGYFPLLAKNTERLSLALVYGGGKGGTLENDIQDLLKNKKTVQNIYDANYQFPQPPDRPTLVAVPGDRQVTLYWDRIAEESIDPVLREKDFEGYKIYRSTDPDFSDIFTITDGSGSPQGYAPIAQYDIKNGVSGYFRPNIELFQDAAGFSFFLGSDNGLVHSFVDRGLENGRRYYYAVVAYDRGDEALGVFPDENSKFVSILSTGEIKTDANVVVVIPNKPVAGYQMPETGVALTHTLKFGTGKASYNVLDPRDITGHTYRVTFLDNLLDGRDNNSNGRIDAADSTEWDTKTTFYTVENLDEVFESIIVTDTLPALMKRKHIIGSTIGVYNSAGALINPGNYDIDTLRGIFRARSLTAMPKGTYELRYRHYPVYESQNIKGSPFKAETQDAEFFDGVSINFSNDWTVRVVDSLTGWRGGKNPYVWDIFPTNLPTLDLIGYRKPSDYVLFFDTTIVTYSLADPVLGIDSIPAYFKIFNLTENREVKFIYADFDYISGTTGPGYGKLSPFDELILMEPSPTGIGLVPTWDIFFINKLGEPADTVYKLTKNDTLIFRLTKPFRKGDVFEFSTVKPIVNQIVAKNQLANIRVVPNPYVTASAHEPPLPPGITSGRGTRKIDFTNIPLDAKIHIYTSRGDHVITLLHGGLIENGTVSWNLKTKENLDIAYGVYFYIVESPVGNRTGKFAVIK